MRRRAIFASTTALAVVWCAVPMVAAPVQVHAAATYTSALYEMNEPAGSTVLVDSSGNGRNGAIGPNVQEAVVFDGATAHRFLNRSPNLLPVEPERLDTVPHTSLHNPDNQEYAVSVRYRTTKSFGNLIQKGQNGTTGGYFKIELPYGRPTCLFKGVQNGRTVQRAIEAPVGNELNDNQWHVVKCERLSTRIALWIDGVEVKRLVGSTGTIANDRNLSIAGKSNCDQVETTCDYFVGDIDWVRIEKGSGTTNPPPVPSFTSSCTYLVCTFNASGTTDNGSIASYAWNYGTTPTSTGTGVSPTKTFPAGGTYTVSMTATDNQGASATTTRVVTVAANQPPVARFTETCSLLTCTFDASTSSDPENTALTYSWNFGETGSPTNTATGVSPSHTYASGATRLVTLTVRDAGNVTGVTSHNVISVDNAPPVPTFTYSCVELVCTLDPSASTDTTGPIASFSWTFPNDATPELPLATMPVVAFAGPGTHSVTLEATDVHGASASVTLAVSIVPPLPPQALFEYSCVDWTCTFDASDSSDANGTPITYSWDFGDTHTEGPNAGPTTTHSFEGPGTFTVGLIVDDGALVGGIAHDVILAPNVDPVAAFTFDCDELQCTFDGTTSTDTPDSGPLTYAWDFDDAGATGTGSTAPHTFTAAGDYQVSLTVTDPLGGSNSTTQTVTVTQVVDPITFVNQTTTGGQLVTHAANVPANVQAGDGLLMFLSVGTTATVGTPAGVTGWTLVDTLSNGTGSTRLYSKVAAPGDAGAQVRITLSTQSKAALTIVAYRGTAATGPIATHTRSLVTASSASRTTPNATVTNPAWVVSYWAHRDSATTALVAPGTVTARSSGSQTGGGRVAVLAADSNGMVPAGPYGGQTATAAASSTWATTWTVVLAPA